MSESYSTTVSNTTKIPTADLVNFGDPPQHKNARATEAAAAERIAPIANSLRQRTLEWIRAAGDEGLTAAEGGAIYAASRGRHPMDGSSRYSIAPRINELVQAGFVRDSGKERDGFIAWTATEKLGDGGTALRQRKQKKGGDNVTL